MHICEICTLDQTQIVLEAGVKLNLPALTLEQGHEKKLF